MNAKSSSSLAAALFASLLLAVFPLQAQETATLESLKQKLTEAEAKLAEPQIDFQAKYTQQLEMLKAKSQQAGDLDQIVAIDTEIKMLPRGGSNIPEKFGQLKRLRKLYDDHSAKLNQEREAKRKRLLAAHRSELMKLQTSLTRAGKIQEALVIKREISSVEASIKAGSPANRPKIPGNSSPGKLVVAGTYTDGNLITLSPEQQNGQFVKVASGYDYWAALDPSGKVSARPGATDYFAIPSRTKDVVDIQCGRHMHALHKADGSVILLSSEDHTQHAPKDLEPGSVAKITMGHSKNAYLLKDGTLLPFGYSFFHSNIQFPRADLLENVADVSVGAHNYAILKKDGALHLVSMKGEDVGGRPEDLKGKDVIQMEGGLNHGTFFLTDKGKVYAWNAPQPPPDLKKAVQVRAGAGLGAAQMEDGSWVIWGDNKGVADPLNQRAAELGPLKDLALGERYFVAIQ